jgi:hypothetical protein
LEDIMNFVININGKDMAATGTKITDTKNGKTFNVISIDSLMVGEKDYAQFLATRDSQLRAEELKTRQDDLDASWTKALEAYKAERPTADANEIASYKAYWMEQPDQLRMTSNRTNGLSATIIDTVTGEAHTAYFMRETKNRFRTYVPRVSATTVAADCPF